MGEDIVIENVNVAAKAIKLQKVIFSSNVDGSVAFRQYC